MWYRLAGVDYESLDQSQRRDIVHRFEAAIRLLDGSCRVYQYLCKRCIAPLQPSRCRNRIVNEALLRLEEELAGKPAAEIFRTSPTATRGAESSDTVHETRDARYPRDHHGDTSQAADAPRRTSQDHRDKQEQGGSGDLLGQGALQRRRDSATITLMKETLRAVFENGVFRPLKRPKGLAERREVTLTVTAEEGPSSLADFGGRISLDDAQEMRDVVEREFERVDPREWE